MDDGFGDHYVAVAIDESRLCGGHQFELPVSDIIAMIGGEEFAVAVVDACEGDKALVFEGIENGVCVFSVIKGQCAFDVCGNQLRLCGGEIHKGVFAVFAL